MIASDARRRSTLPLAAGILAASLGLLSGCGKSSTKTPATEIEPAPEITEGPSVQEKAIRGEDVALPPRPSTMDGDGARVPVTLPADVFEDVRFDFDQAEIRERERRILQRIAAWLADNPGPVVLVEGHADDRGTREYNLALGERRALAVRRYLLTLGVKNERLQTVSYGEERPLAFGQDEESWSLNRRAHFTPLGGGSTS